MTRPVIDINDESLKAAAEVLGTSTRVETVNRAPAEVTAREARNACLADLDKAAIDLADPEAMLGDDPAAPGRRRGREDTRRTPHSGPSRFDRGQRTPRPRGLDARAHTCGATAVS